MGANYMTDPLVFLIDTVVSLYILAVVLRFLLQWIRADFYNPISQFLVKITHPPLRILRRFVPAIGRIDTSSLLLAILLQTLANYAILALKGLSISILALLVLSFADLLKILLDVFVYAIFAGAILSWFAPASYSSVAGIIYSLTEPLLSICRRILPDLGAIDLSPLVALVLLQLAKMMILPPLQQLAGLLS
ncbi:YggT family protein [Methylomonas paludis]|uniref:YggT family protein n=1 Tax=Methylomonas paludis TaxID=1173101 RepID=A0A975RAC3_9GAMM|nr:YggT family protein [Methylomonas paludis]QWF71076.1 YggT family protein [Methylomonas paludis]